MSYSPFSIVPTEVGQSVRATGYGGSVRKDMIGPIGVVVRFTPSGNPVVRVSPAGGAETLEVSDRHGCFRVVDADGNLVQPAD